DGSILFASEVRAIIASGLIAPRLEMKSVATYLAFGAVQQPGTIFENIRALAPGSYQTFSAASNSVPAAAGVTFWSVPRPQGDQPADSAEVVGRVRETLTQAVRDHLVSDVPVALLLS